ncbi:hypothetical protein D3C72_2026310 [compost metagenome]
MSMVKLTDSPAAALKPTQVVLLSPPLGGEKAPDMEDREVVQPARIPCSHSW